MAEKLQKQFYKVLNEIKHARNVAYNNVNSILMELYWNVGKHISKQVTMKKWGQSVVKELAVFIKEHDADIKGFGDKNLWRMKQFYETYVENEKLATLWRQISWSNNRRIMTLKTPEERGFYLKLCVKQKYSYRELDRLINTSTYERTVLADLKLSDTIKKLPQLAIGTFKDKYVFEFLNMPVVHKEKDLQTALVKSLKEFILELGRGFTFIGENYRLQVGQDDFFIDLLFFNRQMQCLVAFELKVTKFKPEHLGQLEFYLEALDRDVKFHHENPSIGVLLCKEKNDEVVEYALSRSVSPAIISEYETKLIPKDLLKKKLNEFYMLLDKTEDD